MWGEDFYRGVNTNAAGEATIFVPANIKLEASVWHNQYLYGGETQSLELEADKSINVEFTVEAPDASIDVTLQLEDGSVPDSLYGYAWCETNDYSENYGNDFYNGTTTISVLVDDETGKFKGNCSVWMSDDTYSIDSQQEVSVGNGETTEVTFTLKDRDAAVVVNVKNFSTGELIGANEEINVYLWNEDNVWYDARLSENPTEIPVTSGKDWYGGVWSEDAGLIPLWSLNDKSVAPDSGETATLVLNVLEQDGVVTMNVSGPNNETVEYGWAWCGNWSDEFIDSQSAVVDSGAEIINGVAEVPLVAGYTYNCGVGLPPEYVDLGWMSPLEQQVEYTDVSQEINTLSYQFTEADAILVGTVNGTDVNHIWCWSWSENGGHSYTETEPGEEYRLNVQSDRKWFAGCDAHQGSTWYWTDEYEFTAQEGEQSPWTAYEDSINETFDATESKVITAPDSTMLTIPSSTLADSGNVTVTGTQVREMYHTDDNPVMPAWDWEATDANGRLIETFNGQVTMEIPYSTEALDAIGTTEDALFAKYYDTTLGEWRLPDNYSIDKGNNILIVNTNHFSQYGIVYNGRLAEAVSKPKQAKKININKRAKKLLKYTVVLKGASDRPTKLQRQIRWKKNGKKGKYTKWKRKKKKSINSTSSRTKWRFTEKKLRKGTKYQIRSRFCNSAGCGKWKRRTVTTKGRYVR